MLVVRLLASLIVLAAPMAAKSALVGTWEGTTNDLPAVKLAIAEDAGKISGTIVFYFQTRGDDGKWRLGEQLDSGVPILVPQMEGKLLTFEVRHHKRHGGTEYGPNKKFSVEITGANEARLREAGDPSAGKGLQLIRVQ
jgi:hypothetical protein